MGFEIGQKIDFNGVGALRPAAQTQKILTQVPTPPPGKGNANIRFTKALSIRFFQL